MSDVEPIELPCEHLWLPVFKCDKAYVDKATEQIPRLHEFYGGYITQCYHCKTLEHALVFYHQNLSEKEIERRVARAAYEKRYAQEMEEQGFRVTQFGNVVRENEP